VTPDTDTLEALRGSYAACFGCGRDNDKGLQLDGFTRNGATVITTFVPPETFAGFEGVLHGGVVATALDEISAWTAMLTEGVFVFTARLDLSYRNKVPTGEPLTLTGTVTDRSGRRLTIESSAADASGTLLAESTGLFVSAGNVEDLTSSVATSPT